MRNRSIEELEESIRRAKSQIKNNDEEIGKIFTELENLVLDKFLDKGCSAKERDEKMLVLSEKRKKWEEEKEKRKKFLDEAGISI